MSLFSPMRPPLALAAGVALALLAFTLQSAVRPWTGDRIPFLFVLPVLTIAAVALGRWPALLVLTAGTVNFLFVLPRPHGLLEITLGDGVPLLAYLFVGGLLIRYGGRLRLTTTRAAQAEERLQLAQEDTGVGLFELDFQTGMAFVSPSMCQMLGVAVQAGPIPLERWLGMLPQSNVDDTRRVLQEKIAAGELRYEREHFFQLDDGERRWLLTRVRIDTTPAGVLAVARGAAIDITARKLTEQLLERTQAGLRQQLEDVQRLQALSQSMVTAGIAPEQALQGLLGLVADFHGARQALIVAAPTETAGARIDSHAGLDAAVLARLEALLQARAGQAQGRPAGERIVAENLPTVPTPAAPEAPLETALAAASGAAAVHATPLHGAAGDVIGAMLVLLPERRRPDPREIRLSDICAGLAGAVLDRERVRAAASANELRFSVALDSSTVPFTILSPVRDESGRIHDFRWSYVNRAAAAALGRTAEGLVGQRIDALMPGAWDERGLLQRYLTVIEQGVACEMEVPMQSKPGGWVHVIASPLPDAVAVWFTEITERRRQQAELQAADRRKDEFLATLAHELRNPLAPIRQAVLLARSPAVGEERKRWAHDVIDRQVQRMALLLDDLLDVSRITRGAVVLRRTRVALSEVVDSALENARPHLDAKHHGLRLGLPEQAWMLHVDPLRLSQVLANLLTNAAKYTDAGGEIRLEARIDAAGLTLAVTDNGIGLSAEQLPRIFEMFSQVPDAVGRSQGGLGIGLSLARGLVELHGGTLEAHSAGIGQGSRFVVALPAACVGGEAPRPPRWPAEPGPAAACGHGLRVVVADDNVDAADSLAEMLRLDGHEVSIAYDGHQAVAAFSRAPHDVALLDVGMPGLGGLDAARAIRGLPSGRQAVLIAVTGWGQEGDRAQALAAGFDHHVTKPVDPTALLALIAVGRAARGSATA